MMLLTQGSITRWQRPGPRAQCRRQGGVPRHPLIAAPASRASLAGCLHGVPVCLTCLVPDIIPLYASA